MESIVIEETEYFYTNKGIVQGKDISELDIISGVNISQAEKDQSIFKKIEVQGMTHYLPLDKMIETSLGFVPVKSIKQGDYIKSFFQKEIQSGSLNVDWDNTGEITKIPPVLTDDFTIFLGIACARISYSDKKITLYKRKNDTKEFLDSYKALIQRLFDKKVSVYEGKYFFSSSNMKKFLDLTIGRKNFFNKIPDIIRNSPLRNQMIFFGELFRQNSHKDQGICVYSGASFSIAKYLNSFLKSIGYVVRYQKHTSGASKVMHRIFITACKDNPLDLEIGSTFKVSFDDKIKMYKKEMNPDHHLVKVNKVSLERKRSVKLSIKSETFSYNHFLLKDNSITS